MDNQEPYNPFTGVDAALRSYFMEVGLIERAEAEGLPTANEPVSSNGCTHHFVDYVGFSEAFRYCSKCDLKLGSLK